MSSAGRRLGEAGDPIPTTSSSAQPPASSSRAKAPTQQKKFASLRDLQSDSHAGHGHGGDDDSDKEQDFYAGGDKSGLAVRDPSQRNQNPDDQIRRLMKTAQRGAPRPDRPDGEPDEPVRAHNFGGGGHTLGGDDLESSYTPGASNESANTRPRPEMVERTLHLWADGFSIDDGQLYRFDDPANRRTLDMINAGSAPMDLMGVQSGQAVDVKLEQHKGENYVQPKKKYRPFDGGGQRLGSPTPGGSSAAYVASTTTSSAPTVTSTADSATAMDVDSSQPTIQIRVQLADGTRLPSRFNTTHTIGDVYAFVERSSPGGQGRPYVLATTMPPKNFTDKDAVLGELAEFKRGGVIVQKWV